MRPIDADALKRRAKKVATQSWKMKITARVETVLNQFIDWINDAPTIEPQQQWIPVSDRLPEEDEIVLVSYKTTDKVHMCKYLDDGSENPWWSYNDDCVAWNNVILAWMPLPAPYREDET